MKKTYPFFLLLFFGLPFVGNAQQCTLLPGDNFCTTCSGLITNGVVGGTIFVGQNNTNTMAVLPAECNGTALTIGQLTIDVRNGSVIDISGSLGVTANSDLTLTGNGNATLTVAGTTFSIKNNEPPTFSDLSAAVADCDANGGCSNIAAAAEDAGIVLPVSLLGWGVTADPKKGVLVQWVSASESGHDYYFLEYSADGEDFEEVARVYSDGADSNEEKAYETYHQPAQGGTAYYRLGQRDYDGAMTDFGVRRVDLDRVAGIFPNPARPGAELSGLEDGQAVQLLTLEGRLTAELQPLNGRIQLPNDVPAGVYILRSGSRTERLIVR